jgi:hypothetical protein
MPGMRDGPAAEKGNLFGLSRRGNVALHFMHYKFCRVRQTLRVTPAMQAGLADHVWKIEELVGLIY